MSGTATKERVIEMYADGVMYKNIAHAMGFKGNGAIVRILADARANGDIRAKQRGPRPARKVPDYEVVWFRPGRNPGVSP